MQTEPATEPTDSDQLWWTFPVVGDDDELDVIRVVAAALERLESAETRGRVLTWAIERYAPGRTSPDSGEGEE